MGIQDLSPSLEANAWSMFAWTPCDGLEERSGHPVSPTADIIACDAINSWNLWKFVKL